MEPYQKRKKLPSNEGTPVKMDMEGGSSDNEENDYEVATYDSNK